MSFTNIWLHVVWSTKYRKPLLEKPARGIIFQHILENARAQSIHVDFINGYVDHVHCLISMNADQNIANIVRSLKGESSFWVNNKTDLLKYPLQWGSGYYAASVGVSGLNTVRRYIQNQEIHHQKKTFAKECENFMRVYGFDRILE
jgi:putative transposase